MRLLDHQDLITHYGIRYSRTHIWRLVRAGKFPQPISAPGCRNQWTSDQIEQHIRRAAASRGVAA